MYANRSFDYKIKQLHIHYHNEQSVVTVLIFYNNKNICFEFVVPGLHITEQIIDENLIQSNTVHPSVSSLIFNHA